LEITPEFLAVIVALISLLSPLITGAINVIYQLRIRHIDRRENQIKSRISPIENTLVSYLTSVGKCCRSLSTINEVEYGMTYPKVLIYLNDSDKSELINFDKNLTISRLSEAKAQLPRITEIIELRLEQLYKEQR